MSHTLAFLLTLWSAPVAPIVPAPTYAPADSIRTDAEIRAAVLRHASDVRTCYESEGLKRNPRLEGMVEVEVTILPTGVVEYAETKTPQLTGVGAKEVAKCLTTAAKNWRFDRGPYLVETVILPFNLRPTISTLPAPGRRAASAAQTTSNSR
jgi:hypothetical protein